MLSLSRFRSTRPRHTVDQAASLAWLAAIHADAAGDPGLAARLARVIDRCACGPTKIGTRHFSVPLHGSRDGHPIYDTTHGVHGAPTGARSKLYSELVDAYFAEAFAGETAPADLIHVTCTGYVSPSGAQKLVANRGWSSRVTHAYHMGCYAAVPAVRIAAGFATPGQRVDIVHTELCSLHLDPTDHRIEQLVVNSLFADGLIRYSLTDTATTGLRILALHEAILPDSADQMGWTVSEWGMQMTLSREVPDRIDGALRGFVTELFRRGGVDLGRLASAVVAVHPGGPKIIDRVRDRLELSEAQVAASRRVLFEHGNMSSATLPHVWMRLLDDPRVPVGTLIPSLAFGPGLTMCGVLLEKHA
jgi:predicted naringenin-chalcone synthase